MWGGVDCLSMRYMEVDIVGIYDNFVYVYVQRKNQVYVYVFICGLCLEFRQWLFYVWVVIGERKEKEIWSWKVVGFVWQCSLRWDYGSGRDGEG